MLMRPMLTRAASRAAHREHLWECRSRQKKVAIG
jgi:hypothetical protein